MARATAPANPKTVLLVDDETLWLEAVNTAVKGAPFRVVTAQGGEEALRKLRSGKPDLILSDVRMPSINGFDLFEQVRTDPALRSIPFVFMSSIDDYDARNAAKELGADGYIEKPFDVEEVRTVLANLLGQWYDQ